MERSGNFYKAIQLGYILISILIGCMAYNSLYEWQEIEALELGNKKIDELRKEINNINIQMIKFSLLGETILEWNDKDIEHYHARRMAMDSMLCRFKATYPAERIDSVRSLLEDKERQMFQIVRLMDEQQSINKKIANQIPVIVQKSVQEQSKKPKRKGFLGIFGKKKEVTPAVSTTILHSVNRNVISEQKVQDRQLSEQADSLAARNAELNRQLQELICQIEEKVQTELQSRENEIVAMREKSFMQVGGLMGFVLLLLLISYIIIHRDAKSIKQYKHKTTDLIRQLEQSVQRNEALITSRKKAVHTITHELRTPLTAITGYAGLIRKEQCEDKSGQYIQNILQSSDRMRDMLNTLLDFFRLDNGKEQPRLSPCRISAITHTLETEFMPVAVNKGLSLSVKTGHDAIVLTDKERIIQIGNNLLSNAVKFTEEGGVSLITEYDNGVLTLVVEDTGTGMTEEEQKQAFGAFERLSNAAAKEGFGLGLAIMRNIVSMLGGTIRLDSKKGKGSRFTVSYENSVRNQMVAETFLATVETLLATFDTLELVVMSHEIQVEIVLTDGQSELERGENGTKYVFKVNHDSLDGETYWRCFAFFMACFMSINAVSNTDVGELVAQRHEKEKLMDRVTAMMELNNSVYNVLGDKFKYSIRQWKHANDKSYVCKADTKGETLTDQNPHTNQLGVQTFSISSTMEWWEEAGWTGVCFMYDRWFAAPPIVGLAFKNLEAGRKIIHEWKEKIAKGEPSIELHLIRGIDKSHPSWYRACVTPEIPFDKITVGRYVAVMCRKHTMTPKDTSNLDNFERVYSQLNKCQLVAVEIDDQMHVNMKIDFSEAIELKRVIITDAWKVSAHEPTRNALEWDDDPIIPESEKTTAPVIELMKNLREVHDKMEKRNFKTV